MKRLILLLTFVLAIGGVNWSHPQQIAYYDIGPGPTVAPIMLAHEVGPGTTYIVSLTITG